DRDALMALRLDVVDAVGGRDHALERRGDKTPHQLRVGAHVGGGHRDGGIFAAWILPHVERADRLHAGDGDGEADHDRDDRASNEQIREVHHLSVGWGAIWALGARWFFTTTAM